jgi:hypothetical protein
MEQTEQGYQAVTNTDIANSVTRQWWQYRKDETKAWTDCSYPHLPNFVPGLQYRIKPVYCPCCGSTIISVDVTGTLVYSCCTCNCKWTESKRKSAPVPVSEPVAVSPFVKPGTVEEVLRRLEFWTRPENNCKFTETARAAIGIIKYASIDSGREMDEE